MRSRERDLLARLTHPNIAQLHDGGVSDAGSPYFTLEHVEGQAITAWCDARARGITARVKLLLKVCEAVQFAHRNLIVHRDLNTRRSRGPEPRVVHPGHDAVSHGSLRGSRERIAPRRQRGARKSRRPSDHATALNNLGLVLMDWHGLDEAEQVYGEALRIATAQLGPRHNVTLIMASNLGYVHGRQGKLDLAERELRDVLARDREAGIKDQVWELNRLGDVRRQLGDWREAMTLHREALQESNALFSPNARQRRYRITFSDWR